MPPNGSPTQGLESIEERLARAHELLDSAAAAPRVEGTAVQSPTRCSLLSDAVAVLPPPTQPSAAGQQDGRSQALQAAQALMQQVLDGIDTPLPDLFAGLGGAPAAPAPELTAAGAEEHHATALQLQLLQRLVTLAGRLPVPSSSTQQREEEQQEQEPGAKQHTKQRHFVGIVEIEDVTDAPEDKAAADAARQRALTRGLLLACATYSGDSISCSGNGSSNGEASRTAEQEPSLFSPWTDAACSEASTQLLHSLVQHADKRAVATTKATAEYAPLSAEQRLLAAALPVLAEELRGPLFAQQRHQRAMDRGEAEPYRGPGTFDRAVAARRLAWLVRQLPCPLLGGAFVTTLLPLLLAAADDPSPAVQRSGQLGLLHLAKVADPGSLSWQRDLLLDVANRMVAGCDEGVWDSALPAAAALVQALEGRDARAPGYHTLLQALITEVERSGHRPMLRLHFMRVLRSQLLPALGLCLVRHFARLMPLLLEWVHAHDVESRVAALYCLAGVAEHCWPRVHVHAPLIWQHLIVLAQQEVADEAARVQRQQRVAGGADKQQQGGVPYSAEGSDEGFGSSQEDTESRDTASEAGMRSQLLDAVGAVAAALAPFGGADVSAHAGASCGN